MTLRLGIERPDRPSEVVAAAEARVITHELERRLGDVTIDFRVDGNPVGPWAASSAAAWPHDVDAVVDPTLLWGVDLPPMTSAFGRTVDPSAGAVRARMLEHLGILPIERVDDSLLDAWGRSGSIRPTDLWLVLNAADDIDLSDPALTALAENQPAADVDGAFDRVVESVADVLPGDALTERLRRAISERDGARADLADAIDRARRAEHEAASRLDELQAELAVLHERIERIELQAGLPPVPGR